MTCTNTRVSHTDQMILDAARRARVLGEHECAGGPTAEAVKKAQTPGLKEGYASLAKSAAAETVSTVAAESTGIVAGILAAASGPLFVGYELVKEANRGHLEGEELNAAHRRDAVNLVFVCVGKHALPSEYVAFKADELKAAGGERGPASKILTRLSVDGDKWQRLVRDVSEGISQMRRSGAQLGIHSKASLKAALAMDPRLQRAYDSNLTLRHAFDSLAFEGDRYGRRLQP